MEVAVWRKSMLRSSFNYGINLSSPALTINYAMCDTVNFDRFVQPNRLSISRWFIVTEPRTIIPRRKTKHFEFNDIQKIHTKRPRTLKNRKHDIQSQRSPPINVTLSLPKKVTKTLIASKWMKQQNVWRRKEYFMYKLWHVTTVTSLLWRCDHASVHSPNLMEFTGEKYTR